MLVLFCLPYCCSPCSCYCHARLHGCTGPGSSRPYRQSKLYANCQSYGEPHSLCQLV